jgi:hypothetical protein
MDSKKYEAFKKWYLAKDKKYNGLGFDKTRKLLAGNKDPMLRNLLTNELKIFISAIKAEKNQEVAEKKEKQEQFEAEKKEKEEAKALKNININTITKNLETEDLSLEGKKIISLQEENKLLDKKIKNLAKDVSLSDKLIQVLEDKIEAIPFTRSIAPVLKENKKGKSEALVLSLADLHCGENVIGTEIYNFNEYNVEILKQRINNIYQSLYSIVANKLKDYAKFDIMYIVLLGDMVPGLIHEELIHYSDPLATSILDASNILAELIVRIATELFPGKIKVICVSGNHGRTTAKPANKAYWNNFDTVVYHHIKALCLNYKNIEFIIEKAYGHIETIKGHDICFEHGDQKVATFANIPIYALLRKVTTMSSMHTKKNGRRLRMYVQGHLHTYIDMESTSVDHIMVCPSMVGNSELSVRMGFDSRAGALLFGIHPTYVKSFGYRLLADKPGAIE